MNRNVCLCRILRKVKSKTTTTITTFGHVIIDDTASKPSIPSWAVSLFRLTGVTQKIAVCCLCVRGRQSVFVWWLTLPCPLAQSLTEQDTWHCPPSVSWWQQRPPVPTVTSHIVSGLELQGNKRFVYHVDVCSEMLLRFFFSGSGFNCLHACN